MRLLLSVSPQWLLLWYAVWSLLTFVVYGWDKRSARRARRRVPERRLHLLAAVGGVPGALLAQQVFRHKNRKAGFQFVTGLIVAAHILGLIFTFWKKAGG